MPYSVDTRLLTGYDLPKLNPVPERMEKILKLSDLMDAHKMQQVKNAEYMKNLEDKKKTEELIRKSNLTPEESSLEAEQKITGNFTPVTPATVPIQEEPYVANPDAGVSDVLKRVQAQRGVQPLLPQLRATPFTGLGTSQQEPEIASAYEPPDRPDSRTVTYPPGSITASQAQAPLQAQPQVAPQQSAIRPINYEAPNQAQAPLQAQPQYQPKAPINPAEELLMSGYKASESPKTSAIPAPSTAPVRDIAQQLENDYYKIGDTYDKIMAAGFPDQAKAYRTDELSEWNNRVAGLKTLEEARAKRGVSDKQKSVSVGALLASTGYKPGYATLEDKISISDALTNSGLVSKEQADRVVNDDVLASNYMNEFEVSQAPFKLKKAEAEAKAELATNEAAAKRANEVFDKEYKTSMLKISKDNANRDAIKTGLEIQKMGLDLGLQRQEANDLYSKKLTAFSDLQKDITFLKNSPMASQYFGGPLQRAWADKAMLAGDKDYLKYDAVFKKVAKGEGLAGLQALKGASSDKELVAVTEASGISRQNQEATFEKLNSMDNTVNSFLSRTVSTQAIKPSTQAIKPNTNNQPGSSGILEYVTDPVTGKLVLKRKK